MSDDIVTRLREAVRWCDHGWNLGNDWYPAPTECRSCIPQREAADEISRLRWQIQGMRDSMDHLEEISKSQRETMTKYLFPQEEQQ